MGQRDCLSRAKLFFNELGSLKDEYQMQFSNIINSHNTKIIKGIHDMIEEVGYLQAQLSITRSERDDFFGEVNILKDEIRQLKSELSNLHPLPEPQETNYQDQDTVHVEDTIAHGEGEDLSIRNEAEEVLPLNNENHMSKTNEIPNEDANDTVQEEANEEDERDGDGREEELSSETIRSKKEGLAVDSNTDKMLQYQPNDIKEATTDCIINNHQKLDLPPGRGESKDNTVHSLEHQGSFLEHVNSSGDYKVHKVSAEPDVIKNFECELCHFKTNSRKNLNTHINKVHNKRQFCTECGKSYASKNTLKEHIETVHLGNKQFKCEQCPYTTGRKNNLKTHVKVVHEKVKRFFCGECSFTHTLKANLLYHIESVHKVGKKFKCEECPYAPASKGSLKKHCDNVHNVGEKKFKCDLCPYKSHSKSPLKKHINNIHLKI